MSDTRSSETAFGDYHLLDSFTHSMEFRLGIEGPLQVKPTMALGGFRNGRSKKTYTLSISISRRVFFMHTVLLVCHNLRGEDTSSTPNKTFTLYCKGLMILSKWIPPILYVSQKASILKSLPAPAPRMLNFSDGTSECSYSSIELHQSSLTALSVELFLQLLRADSLSLRKHR